MEKRRLGRTGHESTFITIGAAGFRDVTQEAVDVAMEQYLAAGANHIDIAPVYGHALERMQKWMPRIRDKVFVGSKTQGRSKSEAWADIRKTFDRLQTDSFDLFQLHAITTMAELDAALEVDGAIRALEEMRDLGHTRWLGITGHGPYSPKVILTALRRFDFDTVMFPVSVAVWRDKQYRREARSLIDYCHEHDVGIQALKTIARGGWGSVEKDCSTWYDPLREADEIADAVNWLFSQDIHTAPGSGEVSVVPNMLAAAERARRLSPSEQDQILDSHRPRFPEPRLAVLPA